MVFLAGERQYAKPDSEARGIMRAKRMSNQEGGFVAEHMQLSDIPKFCAEIEE